ncbi:MAG: 6,7-dimethyl-8-ribityllumazine synthase [Candidatus Moraniibacteriota bacterium]
MQRKTEILEKKLDGNKLKIALVVSRFNSDITEKMLAGALRTLEKNSVPQKNIKIVWVPGSFEIPLACQRLAKTKKFDGIVALGCVIKGDTDHFYYISSEASHGIMRVMLDFSIPVGFGVITTKNLKQSQERCGEKNNKGSEAAQAVLEMLF